MTIIRTSCHTDISTADYYGLHTQRKLHHCVRNMRRQYSIAPLFRGDLLHAQTMCTRLSLCDPQNASVGELGNKARVSLSGISLFSNSDTCRSTLHHCLSCRHLLPILFVNKLKLSKDFSL